MRRPAAADRFLTKPMVVALVLYGLFAVTFASFQVRGDALVYFNLLRKFFGEKPDFAFAYQFGSDIWNAPFFLVGKGLGVIFGFEPRIFHVSFEEISITVATQVGFVLTLYLGWRLLRELDMPAGPGVLFLTAFGSPLFYYVVFEPAMKHAPDTLVLTAAVLFLLRVHTQGLDRQAVILGALAGLSLNIRYVNFAFFFVVAIGLALYRWRAALIATVTAAAVGGAIFAIPAIFGISYFVPSYFPKSSATGRFAAGAHSIVGNTSNPFNGFDATTPFKMLFSNHRGLFVWTPLTALALVGFVLILWRAYDHERKRFLWTLLAAAAGLLAAHSIWGFWDGAFAFSTRFLTGLFPFFLIGVAELRRRFSWYVYPVLAICVAWSVFLAFVHVVGYDGINPGDTPSKMAHVYGRTYTDINDKVWNKGRDRWVYLWNLLHGNDPKHVHGP